MKVVEGHWVTINGVHVYINGNGRISKGPQKLMGYSPSKKNTKPHKGRTATTKSKPSTTSAPKTTTSKRTEYTGKRVTSAPAPQKKQTKKPMFYDKHNYKQAYTEAQLNRYYTPWEKLSTPKKSSKTTNTFKK